MFCDAEVRDAFVVWAHEFVKQREAQHGRVGEPHSVRVKRKWFANFMQVRKVLDGGNNALAASVLEELCNVEGIRIKPKECETFVLDTFLGMYKERVQGNEAERDRGQDPAAPSGYFPPARQGMPGVRPTGTEQVQHR